MAAAAELHSTGVAAHTGSVVDSPSPVISNAGSPSRQSKLVLPSSQTGKPFSIGTRPEYVDYPLTGIKTPHSNDVLCGRGGGSNNHPGNESFRELVNEVKLPYVNCPKREKPLIARRIVEAVRNQTPPGRFLSKSKESKPGLWHDIGDGKAREKTSQALREGAHIIRDMSANQNVAHVLKEAKKAERVERAEKECGVNLPLKPPKITRENVEAAVNRNNVQNIAANRADAHNQDSIAMHGHLNTGNSPPSLPTQGFRSFGEYKAQHPQTTWQPIPPHPQQSGRKFNMIPYAHHQNQLIVLRSNGRLGHNNSVPLETVRRLLLGQIDPVQLAMQLLHPEEAAFVASHHAPSGNGAAHLLMAGGGQGASPPPLPRPISGGTAAVLSAARTKHSPLPLQPMVSDGSLSGSLSDSTQQQIMSTVRRPPFDQSSGALYLGGGGGNGESGRGGDDGSSVESKHSNDGERALPKKKRKYVE